MSPTEHSLILSIMLAGRPLTVKELAKRTSISEPTVYRVCSNSEKLLSTGTRPAQFYATKYAELDTNKLLVTRQRPDVGWIDWAKDTKNNINQLLDIDDDKRSRRELKAQALRGIGTLLLSLSQDITDTLDRPDWREHLGATNAST
jgi:transcriptional antiterminator